MFTRDRFCSLGFFTHLPPISVKRPRRTHVRLSVTERLFFLKIPYLKDVCAFFGFFKYYLFKNNICYVNFGKTGGCLPEISFDFLGFSYIFLL